MLSAVHHLTRLVVGGTARQLATQFAKGEVDSGDAYIAGLLHDFGKVVFAQFLAAEFRNALAYSVEHALPLHEGEKFAIGVDHGPVGAMLAKRWAFPAQPRIGGHDGLGSASRHQPENQDVGTPSAPEPLCRRHSGGQYQASERQHETRYGGFRCRQRRHDDQPHHQRIEAAAVPNQAHHSHRQGHQKHDPQPADAHVECRYLRPDHRP